MPHPILAPTEKAQSTAPVRPWGPGRADSIWKCVGGSDLAAACPPGRWGSWRELRIRWLQGGPMSLAILTMRLIVGVDVER